MGDLLTGQLVKKGPEVSRMTQAISIALITTIMLQVPYFAYRMKINLKPKEEFFSLVHSVRGYNRGCWGRNHTYGLISAGLWIARIQTCQEKCTKCSNRDMPVTEVTKYFDYICNPLHKRKLSDSSKAHCWEFIELLLGN